MKNFDRKPTSVFDTEVFVNDEQQRYIDALQSLRNKIQNAYDTFGPILNEIEAEENIPGHLIQELLVYPIEEIEEITKKLVITKDNMSFALALRDSLLEKNDNLRR
jgi:hypothetical protein